MTQRMVSNYPSNLWHLPDVCLVFVVFKARVDMAAFRQLADLAATHSKPLLRQSVYVS